MDIILHSFSLSFEKEMSKAGAPGLETIYQALLDKAEEEGISAAELADLEWKTDLSSIMPRYAMIDVFRKCIDFGKRVFIMLTVISKSNTTFNLKEYGFDVF